MGDRATPTLHLETTPPEVGAAFDGGRVTSDGGPSWLHRPDEDPGVCEAPSKHIPEWRGPSVRHSLCSRRFASASSG